MNKEEKITISVNEEDVQNIINAYEKDIEYIKQLEKENQKYKEVIDEAIDKLYCWGEALDAEFQKQMLDILKGAE